LDKPHQPACVAVVDDDVSVRAAVLGVLQSAGFRATSFLSAEEFLASDQSLQPVCLISDVQLPGMSGLELQERLIGRGRSLRVIFISAFGDNNTRTRAMKAGAIAFLDKPFNDDALIDLVRSAVEE
jgi:FixJ family two-component response regulator